MHSVGSSYHAYVTVLQLGCAQWPQNVMPSSALHFHFAAPLSLCDIGVQTLMWRKKKDLFVKLLKWDVSWVDICKVSHHYSPLLMPFCSTGQLGQHQHHLAVLPWSPPAVNRGITPGGWAGGPARVQGGRCVGKDALQRTVTTFILATWSLFLPWCNVSILFGVSMVCKKKSERFVNQCCFSKIII